MQQGEHEMKNWSWVADSPHNNEPTGFKEFIWHPGMGGLAKVESSEIHFLALLRTRPEPGLLTEFVSLLTDWYDVIGIWQIMNPNLTRKLVDLGFESATNSFGGELTLGMIKRIAHNPGCDIYDRPPEGIVKPCNCRWEVG